LKFSYSHTFFYRIQPKVCIFFASAPHAITPDTFSTVD
jgi:hypothetical protein